MQTVDYREVLTALRCDVSLLRDSAFGGIREVAKRMLSVIDTALLSTPEVEPVQQVTIRPNLVDFTTDRLLRELARRTQIPENVHRLCARCHRMPRRARGLCVRCYKQGYRRGEFRGEHGTT